MVCGICRRRRNSRISRDEYARRPGHGRDGCAGCCPDPHTSYHATSIVQQANRTNLDYATPLCDEHVPDASSGRHEPDGTRFGHHFLVAHSSGRHSLSARRLSRIPMDAGGSAGDGETPGDRISALLAMAVGEVGSGGGGTVTELQKHATQGGPARSRERAFAFPGLPRLQLTHNDHHKAVHATAVGPFFFRDVRDRRPRLGSRSERVARSECFVFTTREMWSVMP